MALPKIQAVITADTKQAEAGFDRVERGLDGVGKAADNAARRTDAMGAKLDRTAGRSSAFGRGIQNASFQLADFSAQVGAGTSASVALGQQLPQLLGGFGILGAVLGAVAAVAVPLTRAFQGMSEQGADLSQVLGVLSPLAGQLATAFQTVADVGVQMAEVIINNLDRILITAGLVAGFFAAKWVAAFVAARVATFSLAAALGVLRVALIRTGIGAIVVLAGELIYQFGKLVKAVGGFGTAFGLVFDVAKEAFLNIGKVGQGLYHVLLGISQGIAADFIRAFAVIGDKWDQLTSAMAKTWNSIAESSFGQTIGLGTMEGSNAGENLRSQADALEKAGVANIGAGSGLLKTAMPSLEKIKDLLKSVKDERISLPDLLGVASEEGEGGKGGKSAAEKLDEELTAQEERIKTHFDRIKGLAQGGLSDKLGAWGDYFGNLAALTGMNNKKLLQAQKSFAAAQALIDAWGAHNKVLNDPTLPWWARIASAGQVLAAGIGAVSAIRGVSESGSSAASAGAGGASSASAAPAVPTQTVSINLQGDTFSRGSVEGLLEQIQSQLDRGGRLVFS